MQPLDDSSTSAEQFPLDFLRVVIDESDVCPYLPEQTARMPLCVPSVALTGEQVDRLLDAGYRRSGWFYYRTQCPSCSACEPLRIDVSQFEPSRSQRRAMKLGNQHFSLEWRKPTIDAQRLRLFNKHRRERALDRGNAAASASDYQSFLLNASCQVLELGLHYQQQLVAISITDLGANSLSAVYCFFDPEYAWLSPGTYAILQQIELGKMLLAQATAGQPAFTPWLYLGLYVQQNSHLNYKAKFLPHQRRIGGTCGTFSR